MLGAICGSAISMDLAAQSMDPYSVQKSMDCSEICGSRWVQSTDLPVLYPVLTLISLLWINIARQVAVCDWWAILEVSDWYETHVSNNSNFKAATCRDAVFHTTPTVCYSVPSIVEVSGGCQSVNIYVCANEGLLQWNDLHPTQNP